MPAKVNQVKQSARKTIESADAYIRISRYCAFQERSHDEVRSKLSSFGLHTEVVDELLSRLITDGFLNEERFAKAFSGGKFRVKNWGKIKIEHALKSHNVSSKCIAIGLREIDDEDYRATLKKLIMKKAEQLTEENLFKKRDIISKYVIGKGFEPELVWKMLREEIAE